MALKTKGNMKFRNHIPFELLFWVSALILLSTADLGPELDDSHFSLCPLATMGFTWCPGCGIGRAMAHLLHGQMTESWNYHWFGLPGLLIICFRVYTLIRLELKRRVKEKEKSYV
jgi:hypothetical protein